MRPVSIRGREQSFSGHRITILHHVRIAYVAKWMGTQDIHDIVLGHISEDIEHTGKRLATTILTWVQLKSVSKSRPGPCPK